MPDYTLHIGICQVWGVLSCGAVGASAYRYGLGREARHPIRRVAADRKRLDTEPRQADCNAGETLGTQDGDVGSALDELSLSEAIHRVIGCLDGESFYGFDIVETATNHNHEDIVESIDTYQCVAYRQF